MERKKLSMLFVCGGNTCRSPMAVGLARELLGGIAHIESAGIASYGASASEKALQVMESLFGIDISDHHPRSVAEVSLDQFDYVIAMDSYVYRHFLESYQLAKEKLIEWDIADPYLQGLDAYEECATDIRRLLEGFLTDVIAASSVQMSPKNTVGKHAMQQSNLPDTIVELRDDIERWQRELEAGELRGTLLHGIASKALNSFEKVLRELLKYYLMLSDVDYPEILRNDMNGKDLDKLTLGQVIQAFIKLDKQFTNCCRSQFIQTRELLANRRLLIKTVRNQLNQIKRFRNILYHHPDEYAPDESTLNSNARQTLSLLQEVLAEVLFEVPLFEGSA